MTLREQVEALRVTASDAEYVVFHKATLYAALDAHRCENPYETVSLDPEKLARALRAESKRQHDPEHGRWTFDEGEDPIYDELLMRDARSLAVAYEEIDAS